MTFEGSGLPDFDYNSGGFKTTILMMKLKVEVNGEQPYEVHENNGLAFLNNTEVKYNVHRKGKNEYLLYQGHKVYSISVINTTENGLTLDIDGHSFEVSVKDHIAQILEDLGMDVTASEVVNEINAPMPGSIIDIMVTEGQEIKEGDTILILEAMKMENIIKSPVNATVQKLHVSKGQNVEKNHVLVSF